MRFSRPLFLCALALTSLSTEEAIDAVERLQLESLGDRLGFALVGSLIVMGTLFLLWGVSALIAQLFRGQTTSPSAAKPQPTAAPQPAAPIEVTAEPLPIAVIAAAVAATLDQPHRVIAVDRGDGQHWARVGRHQQFESRRIR